MPLLRETQRIVIAGASSLLGAELKSLLEESRFAGADFRLLDEETAAGTVTEAGGEATLIQRVEESSFERARLVFFTGSAEFTKANFAAARAVGAKVIDLSGGLAGGVTDERGAATAWFPALEALRGGVDKSAGLYVIPSAAATCSSALCLTLSGLGLHSMDFMCFQSVSEAGRAGIEELESQTSQLLSLQSVGQPVFDTQVAFALLDRFGAGSHHKLAAARERLRAETALCLRQKAKTPALQVLHAPVFYGAAFAACARFEPAAADAAAISKACAKAGFAITAEGEGPSNISAAGENVIQLATPEADPAEEGAWWFWGAADNMRLPASNALRLAETLS